MLAALGKLSSGCLITSLQQIVEHAVESGEIVKNSLNVVYLQYALVVV